MEFVSEDCKVKKKKSTPKRAVLISFEAFFFFFFKIKMIKIIKNNNKIDTFL